MLKIKNILLKLALLPINFIDEEIIFKNDIFWLNEVKRKKLKELEDFLKNKKLFNNLDYLNKKWDSYLADKNILKNHEQFYINWTGKMGASALVANVYDQLNRPYLIHYLNKFLFKTKNINVLDYGCGSGVLSIEFFKQINNANLYLSDLPNLSKEFVNFQIQDHPNFKNIDINLDKHKDEYFDVIICNDILEHLRSPTKIFRKLDSKLKKSGFLFLQAPWGGGIPGHLPEAKHNWYHNGGNRYLMKNYQKIASYYFYPVRFTQGVFVKL